MDIHPINLLKDSLRNEETEIRLKALNRLISIAAALSPERARLELLPFLLEFVETDTEDECLLALANELGKREFVELIGGADHAATLLPILENLLGVEETVVRDSAVIAMKLVLSLIPASEIAVTMAVFKRLSGGSPPDNWYTSKVSLAKVASTYYPKAGGSQLELRALFVELSKEETPMVRRAVAANLADLCAVVENKILVDEIIPVFKALVDDTQDSVRLIAIENLYRVAAFLTQDQADSYLLAIIKSCVDDNSWRIRNAIGAHLAEIAAALPSTVVVKDMLPALLYLLQDSETEVRASSTKNIQGFYALIGDAQFKSSVMPIMFNITADVNPQVRTNLCDVIMNLAAKLGEKALNIVASKLLKDECNDVRLGVLKKLSLLAPVNSDIIKNTILPAVQEIANDKQWRIREAVLDGLPNMAKALGPAFFDEYLLNLYLNAYNDSVNAVRMTSTKSLILLSQVFGEDWTASRFVPKLAKFWDSATCYLQRITVLYAIKALSVEVKSKSLITDLFPRVMKGCKDGTPNVRFVAILTLQELLPLVDAKSMSSQVKPCLEELQRDKDSDVQYYATRCLALCP